MDDKSREDMGFSNIDGEQYHQDQELPPPYPGEGESGAQSTPRYPPQSHHAQAPSRALQVEYTSWKGNGLRVIDTGPEATMLYTADLKIRKPQMTFKTGLTESNLATVEFRSLTPKIDISVHGQAITLRVKPTLKPEVTYESPALQNAVISWRSKSYFKMFNFECLDENSVTLAKISANSWSMKKACRIDIFGMKASSGIVMDEVVVTGLALAQYTLIMTAAAVA